MNFFHSTIDPWGDMFPTEFGIDQQIMSRLLSEALCRGGTYADLYCEYRTSSQIRMEEGLIKQASREIFRGMGIRVVHGEQTGYAFSEDLDPARLKQAAATAAAIAAGPAKPGPSSFQPVEIENRYPVECPTGDTTVEERIALIREADSAARAFDTRIRHVNVTFSEGVRNILIATSEGRILKDERPIISFGIRATAEENGNRQQGRSGGGGQMGMEYFSHLKSTHDHGAEAARQAIVLLGAVEAPAGPMEVILAPGESGILLHEAIGHPLEADFNRKGTSAYSNRLGEKVASPLCTVVDDATVFNDRGALNFDDEGVVGHATELIENGVLRGYMHDRISAAHFGVQPTGNGRRESYKYHPIPRMTTTYMRPGTSDPEEIIESTRRGIFCRSFRGGQVDISNGDFVFVPSEAYLVENGKLCTPVKNLTLIGNGPDVLTRVSMVGDDLRISDGLWTCGKGQSVTVGVGLPTIKISEITVGGNTI